MSTKVRGEAPSCHELRLERWVSGPRSPTWTSRSCFLHFSVFARAPFLLIPREQKEHERTETLFQTL